MSTAAHVVALGSHSTRSPVQHSTDFTHPRPRQLTLGPVSGVDGIARPKQNGHLLCRQRFALLKTKCKPWKLMIWNRFKTESVRNVVHLQWYAGLTRFLVNLRLGNCLLRSAVCLKCRCQFQTLRAEMQYVMSVSLVSCSIRLDEHHV